MGLSTLAASASPAAPQSGAGQALHPEPEWITRAADELGWGWARIAWQRAASVPGAWFDAAKADVVVRCWPKTFCLTTKRFAGKPFRLAFWQEIIVRLVVGWKKPLELLDETTGQPTVIYVRVFQELRLWIARKNGKSEFLAALALLFWAIEGEQRGQGFCFARKEEQAREVFDKMADMVGYSPTFAAEIKAYAKALWQQGRKSAFKLLPGTGTGQHGKGASVTVGDEMHEWRDRLLAETLRQGEGTSTQPIRLYASTAGLKTHAVGRELYQESLQILDGRIDDPTTLIVIFEVPEDADWTDEKNWHLANPSLGLSPTLDFLRTEFRKAKGKPSAEAAFRRYHLNQWVEDISRWLKAMHWDACKPAPPAPKFAKPSRPAWLRWWESDELRGRECVLSFDSTWTFDFASMCLRFKPLTPDERPKFLWRFWLPADTLAERRKAEHVAFDTWRDQGAIEEIPGGVFELPWAIKAASEAHQKFKVTRIGWDLWTAKEFYRALVAEGLSESIFEEMRFGTKTLGEASKSFENRVRGAGLDHGGHPVARWMALQCHIRFDENMNFVPAKKKSAQSIDGIVAAVMCEALSMGDQPPDLASWLKKAVMS